VTAPRRVRVTSPQTRIALSRRHRPAHHLRPQPLPGTGEADERETARARELFARQRRQTARTLGLLALLLFGLSGLLAALPVLGRVTVAGFPASWLLLMTGSYPVLLVIGVVHVRAAERIERDGDR
jgi:putative solute:sodium symporter small subunit